MFKEALITNANLCLTNVQHFFELSKKEAWGIIMVSLI